MGVNRVVTLIMLLILILILILILLPQLPPTKSPCALRTAQKGGSARDYDQE